jgi:protein-disulfide isomerase
MKWYQTVWGIALLGFAGVVMVGVIAFGSITIRFWWQIRHGGNAVLQQQYGGFDRQQASAQTANVDRSVLEKGDFPSLGNPNAPITVVLFGDFKCPNTKNAWPIMQRLLGQYSDKVRLVFRHFPGESIHPGANKLAQLSVCTYKQSQEAYWGLHNYLFAHQNELPVNLSDQDIAKIAQELNLDMTQLNSCLSSSEASLVKINRDYADGVRFGVGGTPTFFVNGKKIEGVVPWEVWDGFVKQF